MSDFNQPQYASYIKLCIELMLPRRGLVGDWFLSYPKSEPPSEVLLCSGSQSGYFIIPSNFYDHTYVWVPSLADWLEMLEEAGSRLVDFGPTGYSSRGREHKWHCSQSYTLAHHETGKRPERGEGATREEAAARLWVTITQALANTPKNLKD